MQNRRLHYDRVGQHRWRCGVCRHFQLQPEQGTARARRLFRSCLAKRRTYTYADTDCISNANRYADGNTHGHSYTYSNRYTEWYAYSHAEADAHAASGTHAKGSPHSGATSLTPK